MLRWLCGVGVCGFGYLIVALCVVHKCNGKIEGLKWMKFAM